MAEIRPLRGVRFNPDRSGAVGPLLAPPYDVASETGAGTAFSIRNIEAVDLRGDGDDHRLAADRYRDWLRSGVLVRDRDEAVYVHRHAFSNDGAPVQRTGLLARVRLTDWTERVILPHETTTRGPRVERLERLRAVRANLSPLYFLYRDPGGEIRRMIDDSVGGSQHVENRDQMGGTHGLQPLSGRAFLTSLGEAFAERTLFVADGHHRYEAALGYRDECRGQGEWDASAPSEFVLALLAAVEDPGVIVRPTHRVLLGDEALSADAMVAALRPWFDLRPVQVQVQGAMPLGDETFVVRVVLPGDSGVLDLHWLPGLPHLKLLPSDRGPAWRSLGVAAIHAAVEHVYGSRIQTGVPRLVPVVNEQDAVLQVESGEAQAAFLMPPPSLDRLLAVAEQGDLLPAKSTWFEPKAPAGLVINDLRTG